MSHKKFLTKIVVLSILFALVLDVVLSIVFVGFGYEPTQAKLKSYFSYGTSTSKKLFMHLGLEGSPVHSIAIAGWNETIPDRIRSHDASCEIRFTFYGMSFSNRVSEELSQLNHCVSIRQIAGPGSPLSHSYFMAETYARQDDAHYAVLGILASALPKISTMAHFNSAFEFPGAHMYPRYSMDDSGKLVSVRPLASSLQEMQNIMKSDQLRSDLISQLRNHDAYFNDFVFGYSAFDYSNIAKMFRRSYAQKSKRNVISKLYDGHFYTNRAGIRDTSKGLVLAFVDEVKKYGQRPVVLLINDRDYAQALDELLIETLVSNDVQFISSSEYIESSDLSNFLPDGHFTQENDRKLAAALNEIVESK